MNLQQFNREVVEFHRIMGNRKFWQDRQTPTPILDKAANTLWTCYVNMDGTAEDVARAAITLESTINEFHDRQSVGELGIVLRERFGHNELVCS